MKKRIMGLMAGAVLMTGMLMTPVMAAEEADVIGTWYLNVMDMEGTQMNPASMGMELSMEVSEDGTVLAKMTDEEDTRGTWVIEDGVLVFTDENDTVMNFTFADEELTTEEDGVKMIFGREKAEAEIFEPGEIVAEPKLEDFNGKWAATIMEAFGMQMPVAMAEMEMTLEIEGGKATLHFNDGMTATDAELIGSLEGDTLKLANPEAAEDEFYMYFDPNVLTLKLHESGVLSYSSEETSEDEMDPETVIDSEDPETDEDEMEDMSVAVYFEHE